MQSYDVYLKEQRQFYKQQYRYFYSYLQHQTQAIKYLGYFSSNLRTFIPSYSCQTTLKPLFTAMCVSAQNVVDQLTKLTAKLSDTLPCLFAENEIRAITQVYRQHKTIQNNHNNKQLLDNQQFQNHNANFVKAAAAYEYDRVRKAKSLCYQFSHAYTELSAKILQQIAFLSQEVGKIGDFDCLKSVAAKFSDLDCGISTTELLGIPTLQQSQKSGSGNHASAQKENVKTKVQQVILHTGESHENSETEDFNLRSQQGGLGCQQQPIISLQENLQPHTSTDSFSINRARNVLAQQQNQQPQQRNQHQITHITLPQFKFEDSLLDDNSDDEKLLKMSFPVKPREDDNTSQCSRETYGLSELLEKQKQLEILQKELFAEKEVK